MRYIFFILSFGIGIFSVEAQVSYTTINGHAVMVGEYHSTKIIAESHKAVILFNYKTAEVQGKIELKTFDTGVDSLNNFLRSALMFIM